MKTNLMNQIVICGLLFALITGCDKQRNNSDASGTFEAEEVIVSAEQTGKIIELNIDEGQVLAAGAKIGRIDVTGLALQRDQAVASMQAINQKVNEAKPQIDVLQSQIATQRAQVQTLQQQLAVLNKEIERTSNLLKADAATQKQYDDLAGQKLVLQKQIITAQQQVAVLEQQMIAASQNVQIQNRSILSEIEPSKKRVDIIEEQISRGLIKNPYPGTVLTKYAMAGEYTSAGKPLYKIADLSTITLRAYVSGRQLPALRLHETVNVLTDNGQDGYNANEGVISWISDKAEFTPKTIQTRDERVNLVYAIKVLVKNDGRYKIGMYGEIKFK